MVNLNKHTKCTAVIHNMAQKSSDYFPRNLQISVWHLLVGWEINVPFQQKISYIRDEILGTDLILGR